jgi:TPR repeat protein
MDRIRLAAAGVALLAAACARTRSDPPPSVQLPPAVSSGQPSPVKQPQAECYTLQACHDSCRQGELGACVREGRVYEHGIGVPRDLHRAADIYRPLCDAHELEACTRLADLYTFRTGFELDEARAAALFVSTCDAGEPVACDKLSTMVRFGKGVPRDDAKSKALAERARDIYRARCDARDAAGCYHLAIRAGFEDSAKAAALHEQACDMGSADACSSLGNMLELGRTDASGRQVVAPDVARSIQLQTGACASGCVDACHWLAWDYRVGRGVAPDPSRALEPEDRACNGWVGMACEKLGDAYLAGEGVAKDDARAKAYFERACGLRSWPACRKAEGQAP